MNIKYIDLLTLLIHHDLLIEAISLQALVLEFVHLVVNELSEMLEMKQLLQELLTVEPRLEEPDTSNHHHHQDNITQDHHYHMWW